MSQLPDDDPYGGDMLALRSVSQSTRIWEDIQITFIEEDFKKLGSNPPFFTVCSRSASMVIQRRCMVASLHPHSSGTIHPPFLSSLLTLSPCRFHLPPILNFISSNSTSCSSRASCQLQASLSRPSTYTFALAGFGTEDPLPRAVDTTQAQSPAL